MIKLFIVFHLIKMLIFNKFVSVSPLKKTFYEEIFADNRYVGIAGFVYIIFSGNEATKANKQQSAGPSAGVFLLFLEIVTTFMRFE